MKHQRVGNVRDDHVDSSSMQKKLVHEQLDEDGLKTFAWIRKNYRVEGISCMEWSNEPDWFLSPRRVWDSFFLLVIEGKVRVCLDAGQVEVASGGVLCLPDGVSHEMTSIGGPLRQLAFHAHIYNDVGESLLQRFSTPALDLRRPEGFIEAFKRCAQWMNQEPAVGKERLGQLIWPFLQELIESGLKVERGGSDLDPRVEGAMTLLRKNLGHNWSLPEVGRQVGLGPARLRSLFSKTLGMGPKAWLLKKRMEKGAELLLETGAAVLKVAHTVGYPDEHHFQRSFKRWSGLTPTEFRNQKHL